MGGAIQTFDWNLDGVEHGAVLNNANLFVNPYNTPLIGTIMQKLYAVSSMDTARSAGWVATGLYECGLMQTERTLAAAKLFLPRIIEIDDELSGYLAQAVERPELERLAQLAENDDDSCVDAAWKAANDIALHLSQSYESLRPWVLGVLDQYRQAWAQPQQAAPAPAQWQPRDSGPDPDAIRSVYNNDGYDQQQQQWQPRDSGPDPDAVRSVYNNDGYDQQQQQWQSPTQNADSPAQAGPQFYTRNGMMVTVPSPERDVNELRVEGVYKNEEEAADSSAAAAQPAPQAQQAAPQAQQAAGGLTARRPTEQELATANGTNLARWVSGVSTGETAKITYAESGQVLMLGDGHDFAAVKWLGEQPTRGHGTITFKRNRMSANEFVVLPGRGSNGQTVARLLKQLVASSSDYPYRDGSRVSVKVGG